MNQSTENIFDLSMVAENLIPLGDVYPSIFDAHFNHSWHPFHSLSFPALKTAPTHLPEAKIFFRAPGGCAGTLWKCVPSSFPLQISPCLLCRILRSSPRK